jgi:class 3 adenylate cyclase
MYRAQSEHTWMANVIEDVEAALEKAGLHRVKVQHPAMCFLDLSGYTRLTEQQGDDVAARLAGVLGRLVQRLANEHEGRPVKWLGDGVMLHFKAPRPAVLAALEMVEAVPKADLPPAHVGIETGPVIHQDGDYFGRTVNAAARIAGYAIAGQVLVSDRVMKASSGRGAMFVEIGPVELKGFTQPVQLYQAHRSS